TLTGGPLGGITVRLGHPDAPALVPGERDGLVQVRFRRDQLDAESFRHVHLRDRLFGRRLRRASQRVGVEVGKDGAGLETFNLGKWLFGDDGGACPAEEKNSDREICERPMRRCWTPHDALGIRESCGKVKTLNGEASQLK